MSDDIRDKGGKFIKGNPGGALKQPADSKVQVLDDVEELRDDISLLRRSGYRRILKKFKNLSQMDLRSFENQSLNKDRLTIEDAAFMSFFKKMVEQGDVNRMRFYFATYGIPTELKAIAVQDIDSVLSDKKVDSTSAYDLELSDDETLEMLDKMRKVIEEKKNG